MALTTRAAYEESIANWAIDDQRRFELEQARAQAVRDEEQRRIANATLGAVENQPLAQFSRGQMAPLPAAIAPQQPLAALAAPARAAPAHAAYSSPYVDDAAGIVGRDATPHQPTALSSAYRQDQPGSAPHEMDRITRYSPDDTGAPPGLDTHVTDGVMAQHPPATPEQQASLQEQSNAATRALQQEQMAAMARGQRAQEQEQLSAAHAEAEAKKATPVSSQLIDKMTGEQPAPGPSGPGPGAGPGSEPGAEFPPMKVESAPELAAIAKLAPKLGNEQIKEAVTSLTHQSGMDFNNADRLDRYARAVARVDPKGSIAAMEKAGELRARGWLAEEKALKFAADRFDQIGGLAGAVETQEDLDRVLMIAGARGFDTSMIPRDIASAKRALQQVAIMSQTHKEQIKEVQDNRRLAIDEEKARNKAELDDANARLKDAQAAKAQSEVGLGRDRLELEKLKAANKYEIDLQKQEQKEAAAQQKKIDDAFKDDDKKHRLSLSITNSYMAQSKEFRSLAGGARTAINYMNDIAANRVNATPDKDFSMLFAYIDAITDVNSRPAYKTTADVEKHPGLPIRWVESVKKIGVGSVMVDKHRQEMYDAMLERVRPLNEDQTLLENATRQRLQDGTGSSDYMLTYSLPELTMQSGAGVGSPNAPSAAREQFKIRLDPDSPESENLAKIMAIKDEATREAMLADYKKQREAGQSSGQKWPSPSQEAIDDVIAHPDRAEEFKKYYGPDSLPKGVR